MERGALSIRDLPGGLDLTATLESGQSYVWFRDDGAMYETRQSAGGTGWYHTIVDDEFVRVRQRDGVLEWESTTDAVPALTRLLRLDDDLEAIASETSDDPLVATAYDAYPGMRLVRDPPFACLISFICSAQMRVERIHAMQHALAKAFGKPLTVDSRTYHAFPTPKRLADATEAECRELGLGYRAPYVRTTAEMVANGEASPNVAAALPYEDAREYLTQFVGVGEKVADCVLLFSLDFLEAVPLDTWIRSAIETHYPHCNRGSYAETSRAIREELGGRYAGYAQTYLFHFLRTGSD